MSWSGSPGARRRLIRGLVFGAGAGALLGALGLSLSSCTDATLCQIPGGVDMRLVLATPGDYGNLTIVRTGDWDTTSPGANAQCSDALSALPANVETTALVLAPTNQDGNNTVLVQDNLRTGNWTFRLSVTGLNFPEMDAECVAAVTTGTRTIVTFTEGSNECTTAPGAEIPPS